MTAPYIQHKNTSARIFTTLTRPLSSRGSYLRFLLTAALVAGLAFLNGELAGTAPLFLFALGGSGSTPFLSTWNGKRFKLENDFLFGQPKSFFNDAAEGISRYEQGAITPDLYRIQNEVELDERGAFKAQIKEIEPEESFIDHLSLLRVRHLKSTELVVDSKFREFHLFERSAMSSLEGAGGQQVSFNGVDVSTDAGNTEHLWDDVGDTDGYMLDPKQDVVEVRGKIDADSEAYLLLRAHIRDWTAGEIFEDAEEPLGTPLHPVRRGTLAEPVLTSVRTGFTTVVRRLAEIIKQPVGSLK